MKVNLFYLSPNTTGGWVTFTAHLVAALRAVGLEPQIYKVGNNTEGKDRNFGYALGYRNVSGTDAADLAMREPSIVVAGAKNFADTTELLVDMGAKLIVHDPTELRNLPVKSLDASNTIVIRKVALTYLPFATLILHPYKRQLTNSDNENKTVHAVSTSRIDFDKNTTMILDANRLLENEAHKVQIHGFENRLYTKFKVCPLYPEWEQSKVAYSRTMTAAVDILNSAKYMVDMSIIKGDGGGTQYTTLEAWDAGAVPIIHRAWLREGDEMRDSYNCIAVSSAEELAEVLQYPEGHYPMMFKVQSGYDALDNHHPEIIGQQYKDFLGL